jgi:hypothetical protein
MLAAAYSKRKSLDLASWNPGPNPEDIEILVSVFLLLV